MSFRPTSLKDRVRAISLVGILAAVPMYSCATSQSVQEQVAVTPEVSQPAPVATEPVMLEECNPEIGAADYLEAGFEYIQKNAVKEATHSFGCAVSTGYLNDAGSALAYWHIAAGHSDLGHMDEACEAFTAFILYASDLLEERAERSNDFVTNFSLEEKLDQARATISVEWAKRSSYFGRSEDSPIPVHNEDEMQLFFSYLHDCFFKSFDRNPISEGSNIERILYECREDGGSEEYFFDFLDR